MELLVLSVRMRCRIWMQFPKNKISRFSNLFVKTIQMLDVEFNFKVCITRQYVRYEAVNCKSQVDIWCIVISIKV